MTTLLMDNRIEHSPGARVANGDLWMPVAEFQRVTVDEAPAQADTGGDINVSAHWRSQGRPVLSNEAGDVFVLGRSARERSDALASLAAPDFTLPDLDGKPHSLSDYRGNKVFLASWSSW